MAGWITFAVCLLFVASNARLFCHCTKQDLQDLEQAKVKVQASLDQCKLDLGDSREQKSWHERSASKCDAELARSQSMLQEKQDVHGSCQNDLVSATSDREYAIQLQAKLEAEKKDLHDQLRFQREQNDQDKKKLFKLEEDLKLYTQRLLSSNEDKNACEERFNQKADELSLKNAIILEKEKSFGTCQEKLVDVMSERDILSRSKKDLESELDELKENSTYLRKEAEEYKKETEKLSQDGRKFRQDLAICREKGDLYEARIKNHEDDLVRKGAIIEAKENSLSNCQDRLVTISSEKEVAFSLKERINLEKKQLQENFLKQKQKCDDEKQNSLDLETSLSNCRKDLTLLNGENDSHSKRVYQKEDLLSKKNTIISEKNALISEKERELINCKDKLIVSTSKKELAETMQSNLESEKRNLREELQKQRSQCDLDKKEIQKEIRDFRDRCVEDKRNMREKFDADKKSKGEEYDSQLKEFVTKEQDCKLKQNDLSRSLEFCEQSKGAEVTKGEKCETQLSTCQTAHRRVEENVYNLTNINNLLAYKENVTKQQERDATTWNVMPVFVTFLFTSLVFIGGICYFLCTGKLLWIGYGSSLKAMNSDLSSRDLRRDSSCPRSDRSRHSDETYQAGNQSPIHNENNGRSFEQAGIMYDDQLPNSNTSLRYTSHQTPAPHVNIQQSQLSLQQPPHIPATSYEQFHEYPRPNQYHDTQQAPPLNQVNFNSIQRSRLATPPNLDTATVTPQSIDNEVELRKSKLRALEEEEEKRKQEQREEEKQLKKEQEALEKKMEEAVLRLVGKAEAHGKKIREKVVSEVSSLEECCNELKDALYSFAQDFVSNDETLRELPVEEIEELRSSLQPPYESAYKREVEKREEAKRLEKEALEKKEKEERRQRKKEAKKEMVAEAEVYANGIKDTIVSNAKSLQQCYDDLESSLHSFAESYLQGHDLLRKVPKGFENLCETLKSEYKTSYELCLVARRSSSSASPSPSPELTDEEDGSNPGFTVQPHEIDLIHSQDNHLFDPEPKENLVPQKRATTEIHKVEDVKRAKHKHKTEDDAIDMMEEEVDGIKQEENEEKNIDQDELSSKVDAAVDTQV